MNPKDFREEGWKAALNIVAIHLRESGDVKWILRQVEHMQARPEDYGAFKRISSYQPPERPSNI